jgi:hypothetical protein
MSICLQNFSFRLWNFSYKSSVGILTLFTCLFECSLRFLIIFKTRCLNSLAFQNFQYIWTWLLVSHEFLIHCYLHIFQFYRKVVLVSSLVMRNIWPGLLREKNTSYYKSNTTKQTRYGNTIKNSSLKKYFTTNIHGN